MPASCAPLDRARRPTAGRSISCCCSTGGDLALSPARPACAVPCARPRSGATTALDRDQLRGLLAILARLREQVAAVRVLALAGLPTPAMQIIRSISGDVDMALVDAAAAQGGPPVRRVPLAAGGGRVLEASRRRRSRVSRRRRAALSRRARLLRRQQLRALAPGVPGAPVGSRASSFPRRQRDQTGSGPSAQSASISRRCGYRAARLFPDAAPSAAPRPRPPPWPRQRGRAGAGPRRARGRRDRARPDALAHRGRRAGSGTVS